MGKRHLARKVSVIGGSYILGDVRTTPEFKDFSERELAAKTALEAMQDANILAKDIDAFYMGMSGPDAAKMKGASPFFEGWFGMKYKPTMFVDAGCGSTGVCLGAAVSAIAAGVYDCVLISGININSTQPRFGYPPHLRSPLTNDELTANVYEGYDAAYTKPSTGGVASFDADMVTYMKKYGYSIDEVDDAVIKYIIDKRHEAVANPRATLAVMTFEEEAKRFGFDNAFDYLKSNKFNPHMSLLVRGRAMGMPMDGSSAIIVCASEIAHRYTDKPVEVAGFAVSCRPDNESLGLENTDDLNMFRDAYDLADITDPYTQIDHMYIHDCPAVQIPIVAEGAGYVRPGESIGLMANGGFAFNGKRPLCTDGGRTQAGHPRGPAFAMMVIEAIDQMRGKAGARQMPTPPRSSLLWGGGAGMTKAVAVLKKQW